MSSVRKISDSSKQHSKEALRTWLRLLRCESLLEQYVRSKLREEFGITLPQFDVMAELDYVDRALSMSELSRQLMVSNGNITGVVDRLVREKYVERMTVIGDRRKQMINLNKKGRTMFKNMARQHEKWVAEAFNGVSADDLRTIIRLLGKTGEKLKINIENSAS